MNDGLTTEEHEVLANYHMNIVENYLHDIDIEISCVKKKPRINYIEHSLDAIKRELEIVKFYNDEIEKANENQS